MKAQNYLDRIESTRIKCPHRGFGCDPKVFTCPPRYNGSDTDCPMRRVYDSYYNPRTVSLVRLVESGRYEDVRIVVEAIASARKTVQGDGAQT